MHIVPLFFRSPKIAVYLSVGSHPKSKERSDLMLSPPLTVLDFAYVCKVALRLFPQFSLRHFMNSSCRLSHPSLQTQSVLFTFPFLYFEFSFSHFHYSDSLYDVSYSSFSVSLEPAMLHTLCLLAGCLFFFFFFLDYYVAICRTLLIRHMSLFQNNILLKMVTGVVVISASARNFWGCHRFHSLLERETVLSCSSFSFHCPRCL